MLPRVKWNSKVVERRRLLNVENAFVFRQCLIVFGNWQIGEPVKLNLLCSIRGLVVLGTSQEEAASLGF